MPPGDEGVRDGALAAELIERVLTRNPVPIADAVAALSASSSAHEKRDRVVECFRALIRYAGALALAARVQYGPGPDAAVAAVATASGPIPVPDRPPDIPSDSSSNGQAGEGERPARKIVASKIVDHPEVVGLLRALRGRGLTDGQWVGLCRGLLRPWARVPEAHPLPDLVRLFHGGKRGRFVRAIDGLLEMRKSETVAHGATGGADAIKEVLDRRLPQLAMLLGRFEPVWQKARLVLPVDDATTDDPGDAAPALMLMGQTPGRDRWRRVTLDGAVELPPGQPVLIDPTGRPLLALAPIGLVRRPSPEAPYELFVLDGARRKRAVYVAVPSMAEHLIADGWRKLDRHLSGATPNDDAEHDLPGQRPYRGLASFESQHISLFFGRDNETEILANRIRGAAMVTVTGPSGSGKTSLLRAGVIPALSDYRAIFVRPGNAPVIALHQALDREFDSEFRDTGGAVPSGGRLADLCRQRGMRLLLCVDQTEELFTLCRDSDERHAFAQLLIRAIAGGVAGPVRVVLSIRGDFFAQLATLPALAGVYSRHVEVVTTPGPDALRDILHRPARAFGYHFEDPELVAAMLAPLAGEPAALAMLQFAADRMWALRDRRWQRLTWDAYEAIGGVEGALTAHADAVLDQLTASQREIARTLLMRLITAEGTRAVVDHRTLLDTAGGGKSCASVLARLVEARLVVVHEADGQPTSGPGSARVELIHEALLARWDRLKDWLDDDREALRVRDRIATAASEWVHQRTAADFLLAEGKPLADAEALLRDRIDLLQPNEIEFIQASLRRRARRRMWARLAVITILAIATAAAFAGLYGWQEGQRAARAAAQRDNAFNRAGQAFMQVEETRKWALASAEEAAEQAGAAAERAEEAAARANEAAVARARSDLDRDPTASLAWLRLLDSEVASRRDAIFAEARNIATIAYDRGIARDVLSAHPGGVAQIAFRADGQTFATGSLGGQLALWDARTIARQDLPGHGDEVLDLTFSPDGSYLASVGADATVVLNRTDRIASEQLSGHTDSVTSVAFAPAGDRLATGGRDRAVLLWDLDQLDKPLERFADFPAAITDLEFSHNGVLLAIADADGGIRVWNQATGETAPLVGHDQRVDAIALSPDGRALASVSRDRTVRVWQLDAGANTDAVGDSVILGKHQQPAHTVTFARDGAFVLSAGETSAYLWPVAGGQPQTMAGQVGAFTDARFAIDDRWVVTTGSDRSVRMWPVGERADTVPALRLRGHGDTVTALAISPDGQTAITGARDGELRIWPLRPTAQVLTGASEIVKTVAIAPDGRHIIAGAGDGRITVWRARGPAPGQSAGDSPWPIFERERELSGHTDIVHHLELSPDGRHFASASSDGTVRVWPLAAAAPDQPAGTVLIDHQSPVWDVAWSPDGARLISSGDDTTARVVSWPGRHTLVLDGHGDAVVHARFSPDGRYVATASWDRRVRLFDSQSGQLVRVLFEHRDVVTRIGWSPGAPPDDIRLLTTSHDRKVRSYRLNTLLDNNLADGEHIPHVVHLAHTDAINYLAVSPDGTYMATGGDDRTVRVWTLGAQGQARSLRGHDDAITSVAFAPDSHRLASASQDGTVRLWNLLAGGHSRVLHGHTGEVNQVVFSADGQLVVSAGDDRTVRVWRSHAPAGATALLDWLRAVSNARWDSSGHLRTPLPGRVNRDTSVP